MDHKSYLWSRYIDDNLFLWEHGREKLKSLGETLNEIHPTINYLRIVTKVRDFFRYYSKEIFKARTLTRETLLEKENMLKHDDRVTFNAK